MTIDLKCGKVDNFEICVRKDWALIPFMDFILLLAAIKTRLFS